MREAGTRAHEANTAKTSMATKRTKATSPKVSEIVDLVHALSSDLGSTDGVVVGRGIAQLLAQAYEDQALPVPRWVKQLAAHYARKPRSR